MYTLKKLSRAMAITIIMMTLAIPTVLATNKPTINKYPAVIDAPKIIITGKSEANATISITGGPNELSPEHANKDGKFTLTLGLKQEATNNFQITATGKDGKASEAVKITVQESAEEAKKLEASSGKDLTAPDAPVIDEIESPIDAKEYEITGKSEANATIKLVGDDIITVKAKEDKTFKIKVYLKQNQKNNFKITSTDTSGNISATVAVVIEEKGAKTEDTKKEEPAKDAKKPLTDISGHWSEIYVNELYNKEIINGYSDGSFKANNNITRAELTKVALLAFNFEVSERIETKPFTDVEIDAWFAKYVQEAKNKNVVGGYADNTFKPLDNITRDAALKILIVASGLNIDNTNISENFSDVANDAWYAKYTAFSKANKVIGGYGDGSFRPANPITRGEVAKIVTLLMELKQKELSTPTI